MKMVDVVPRRAMLCIEKDDAARAVLAQTLSEYELVFTRDAFETLRSMNARAFDAYIIDFWLPDWSGPQLCRAIRDVDPHCPVIFCTGADGDLSRQRAMRAGGNAYLCKPVSSEELKATVTSLVARVDAASLRAKGKMEDAVQSELVRWHPLLAAASTANDASTQSLERSARSRAHKAFVSAGGTRAHFERWWPHVFASARANNGIAARGAAGR
jgi:DNA-binding response OmpR family regulator